MHTTRWRHVRCPHPPAAGVVPEAGTCHVHADASLNAYAPVPCESAHWLETMHVGTLTGKHASPGTPSTVDSAATRAARAECAELERFDDRAVVTRTASLAGALRGDSTLAHRCFNPKLAEYAPRRELAEGDLQGMDAVPCTTAHHAEFVGVYQAPPDIDLRTYRRSTEPIRRQCLALIARFVKVPNDGDLKYRTGWLYWLPDARSWTDGNRAVQCFLWLDDRTVTRSVKGAGPKALPVRSRPPGSGRIRIAPVLSSSQAIRRSGLV